jgi:hypothetical protein
MLGSKLSSGLNAGIKVAQRVAVSNGNSFHKPISSSAKTFGETSSSVDVPKVTAKELAALAVGVGLGTASVLGMAAISNVPTENSAPNIVA